MRACGTWIGKCWPWLVMLLAAFVVFAPALDLSFFSDDHVAIWRTGPAHGTWRTTFFRPITDLTLRLGHWCHGPSPSWHRAFNVALHGTNAFLVFRLFRSALPNGERAAVAGAWFSAVLFLVYPFHTESVVWIVGRESAGATFFLLLALIALTTFRSDRARFASVGLLFFLALCSYEIAICLPLLMLPLMRWGLLPGRERLGAFAALFFGVLVVQVLARWAFMGAAMNMYGVGFFVHGPLVYLANVPKVLCRLVLPPDPDARAQTVRFGLLLLVGMLAVWRMGPKSAKAPHLRDRLLLFGWLLLISCWLAFMGGVSTRTSESDRFLYLPSAFLACSVGAVLAYHLTGGVRWVAFGSLTLLSLFGLGKNLENWIIASRITRGVIGDMRTLAPTGERTITGIPDEFEGAFIFRHGFSEAILLDGQDTAEVMLTGTTGREEMAQRGWTERCRGTLLVPVPEQRIGSLVEDPMYSRSKGHRHFHWEP